MALTINIYYTGENGNIVKICDNKNNVSINENNKTL